MGNCVLPETGASVALAVVVAACAVVAGLVSMRLARRRAVPLVMVVIVGAGSALAVAGPADAAGTCDPAPSTIAVSSLAPTTVATPTTAVGPSTTAVAVATTSTTTASTSTSTTTTSTSTSTTTTSTTTSSTTTSSTTTTTVVPQAPIARDDEFFAVVGQPATFDYFANDDLFGLPAGVGSFWVNGDCGNVVRAVDAGSGMISVEWSTPGTCTSTYRITTAGGTSRVATITIHGVAAP